MDKYYSNQKLQLMFLYLIDKLTIQMSTNDVAMLANQFHKIMACDEVDKITLFNVSFRQKLNYNPFPFIFKVYLLPFMSWFDHSILKELVKYSNNKEAIEQLDQFNTCINYDEPIKSCIPEVSHLMIPCKGNESEYVLLVTKHFNKDHDKMVLQDLLNIKNQLTIHLGITHHALQLVAMHNRLSYFYWMLSKHIQQMIEQGINQGQLALWSKGILATILSDHFFPNKEIQASTECEFLLSDFYAMEVGNLHVCVN